MSKHKHHIIPIYRCKELGIDPDFKDNYAYPTRKQHALIHWGYKCKDLSPLLEVCNPPQYVIDMIPLGDNRDAGAAVLLAEGEIDGIDMSGKNHPNYKHGTFVNCNTIENFWTSEVYKAYIKTPEAREINKRKHANHDAKRAKRPERIAYKKAYNKRPEQIAYKKKYEVENKLIRNKKRRQNYAKKKTERQGIGTLEEFLG